MENSTSMLQKSHEIVTCSRTGTAPELASPDHEIYPLLRYKSADLGLIGGLHGHPHGVSWLRTHTQGRCIVLAPSILRSAALAASGKGEVRDLDLRRDLTHVRVVHGPRPALRVA